MKPDLKIATFTIFILVSFFIIPSISQAQLNCQSEIYLPATNNPKDKFKKGYCFIKLGQFQEGVTRLNGVENELPLVADYVIYYQAAGYQNLGDYNNSSVLFNKILTQYPQSGLKKKVLARLGHIYTVLGDYGNAERIFRFLYSEEKNRRLKASYLLGLGEALEKRGRYSDATSTYKRVWVQFPETNSAQPAYKAATKISSAYAIAFQPTENDYLQRGNILFDKSRWSSALKNYNKLSSKSTEVRTNMAIAMVKTKRLNEAKNILNNINSPRALFWRGKLKTKQGLDREASELYTQIHQLYPNSPLAPEGLYNAARLYQINNSAQKAIKTYDVLIRSYPRNKYAEDGAWYLGWIYYRKGQYREALGTFSAFTDSDSTFNSSNAKYWKARTLEKQGKHDEAHVQYRELAGSTIPTYHTYLAQKKSGHTPKFININPESTVLGPKASRRKEKAQLLISLGMPKEAKFEIIAMEDEAGTKEEFVIVSLLYSQVDDYNKSINVAQGIGLPQANRLSFPKGYKEIVGPYAKKYGVDELLVYSIIREESRFQKDVVSPADAVGLMQLIPPTARSVARQIGINGFSTAMLTIPRINIEMGIFYFKQVLDKFNGDVELALASYNAGPHRAADWKVRFYGLEKDEFIEEVPFRETRNYIRRILRSYGAYKAIYGDTSTSDQPGTSMPEGAEIKYPVN
ncbi:MAG: transglycosylase SLT domain-containing protein [Candidatus Dadabacteria bacterium]|nr:transglycosylase SLT domain-containing protein [Candidatus Dadabacteria bacterium]